MRELHSSGAFKHRKAIKEFCEVFTEWHLATKYAAVKFVKSLIESFFPERSRLH